MVRNKKSVATDAKGRVIERIGNAREGVFNFDQVPENSFARNYLATYYSHGLTLDEEMIIDMLIKYFPKASGSRLLEIGSGPTLHHVIPAAEYFSEIHMADYLPENLHEIQLWKARSPLAHDWNTHTAFTLVHEGKEPTPAAIKEREDLLRAKLKKFLHIDLLQETIVKTPYPAVSSFFCTEEIGITKSEWKKIVKRVTDYVAPGGYLFMSALRGSDYYAVVTPDGKTRHLPCANVTEDDFNELLPRLGFPQQNLFVQGEIQNGQEAEGIFGVVIIAAKKEK